MVLNLGGDESDPLHGTQIQYHWAILYMISFIILFIVLLNINILKQHIYQIFSITLQNISDLQIPLVI